ncbi:MAG: FAD-dependent oxidoreductase [Anaerolineae bacterium]
MAVKWLSGAEARALEPYLSRAVTAAVFSPDDHWVDNRAVVFALAEAAYRRAGGVLRELKRGGRSRIVDGRAVGVDVVGGADGRGAVETVAADGVVVAAGAWSRNLPGLPEIARPPVRPVKGRCSRWRWTPRRRSSAG